MIPNTELPMAEGNFTDEMLAEMNAACENGNLEFIQIDEEMDEELVPETIH